MERFLLPRDLRESYREDEVTAGHLWGAHHPAHEKPGSEWGGKCSVSLGSLVQEQVKPRLSGENGWRWALKGRLPP